MKFTLPAGLAATVTSAGIAGLIALLIGLGAPAITGVAIGAGGIIGLGTLGVSTFAYQNEEIKALTDQMKLRKESFERRRGLRKDRNSLMEFFKDAQQYSLTGEVPNKTIAKGLFEAFGIKVGDNLTEDRMMEMINQNLKILGKVENKLKDGMRKRGLTAPRQGYGFKGTRAAAA